MNKRKRALLQKAINALDVASEYINTVIEDEQESLDNMPDNLNESERYSCMEEAIEQLEEAIEHIDDAKENIENASA